jgi:hypothetical protein
MARFVASLGLPFLLLTVACAARGGRVNASAGAPHGGNVNVAAGVPHGDYVEARTATVFAGACHYASEREMLGREAVMAWRVQSGTWNGIDLTGVEAVAVVAAERNLENADAPRASVLLVKQGAAAAQREAMAAWVRSNHAAVLGEIVAVKTVPLTFEVEGDRFAVKAEPAVELEGRALANRRCCNMPSQIWYDALSPMTRRVVGSVETFRQQDRDLRRDFQYPADNCAFVGTF